MANAPDIPALMTLVAKALVDAPEEVSAEAFDEGGQIVVELQVAENEVGKIIGRQGRMARSLRTILGAAGVEDAQTLSVGDRGIAGSFITIARVLRPQGRRGEVLAEFHTSFPERFASDASFRRWRRTAAGASCSLKSTGSTRVAWC